MLIYTNSNYILASTFKILLYSKLLPLKLANIPSFNFLFLNMHESAGNLGGLIWK